MFYHNISPVLLDIGILQIRYYGLFYALGFLIAYYMIPHVAEKKNIKITKEDSSDFIVYAILGVVLGARIFYILFYNLVYYLQNPIYILFLWEGGLSFHGGLVGALVAIYLFCKKKKIKFMDFADIVAVPVALALAIGRLGNLMNGELYGRITDFSWCIDYSKNMFMQSIPEGCRHPSQVYSTIKNLAIFGILWKLKDKKLERGFVFWSFVALYGLFRTIVEFFRQPDAQIGFIGSFTMGQLLSVPMFLIGSFMIIRLYLYRKN